jgi:UDP-2,4-diacetamido-2,4,6-trideoxy-beta-L-altropyranose hydrolase
MLSDTNIAFVVDASSDIGTGHVVRCKTLANKFIEAGAHVCFVLQSATSAIRMIGQQGYMIVETLNYCASEYPDEVRSIFTDLNIGIVIFDLSEVDLERHRFLESEQNTTLVSITMFDYSLERFEDLTFYPSVEHSGEENILGAGKVIKQYGGPKYFVFREEFKQLEEKLFSNNNFHILITMGGADPYNFTEKVIRSIELMTIPISCTLILGSLSRYYQQNKLLAQKGHQSFNILSEVDNIAELMVAADLAIINGGLTRYELALTGTPFIAISLHEMQYQITEKITDKGASINLGIGSDLSLTMIAASIEKTLLNINRRMDMSRKLKQIFDQKGASRIVHIIDKYVEFQKEYE